MIANSFIPNRYCKDFFEKNSTGSYNQRFFNTFFSGKSLSFVQGGANGKKGGKLIRIHKST
jgi:hypothetical protein